MNEISSREELENKYPEFFRDVVCGNWCPEEWLTLVDTLCSCIRMFLLWESESDPTILQITQVKSKFNGLRFYYQLDTENEKLRNQIRGAVRMAEAYSYYVL